jgi:hypothetical protein
VPATLLLDRTTALSGAATLRNVLGDCGLWTCDPGTEKFGGGVADDPLSMLRSLGAVRQLDVVGTLLKGFKGLARLLIATPN